MTKSAYFVALLLLARFSRRFGFGLARSLELGPDFTRIDEGDRLPGYDFVALGDEHLVDTPADLGHDSAALRGYQLALPLERLREWPEEEKTGSTGNCRSNHPSKLRLATRARRIVFRLGPKLLQCGAAGVQRAGDKRRRGPHDRILRGPPPSFSEQTNMARGRVVMPTGERRTVEVHGLFPGDRFFKCLDNFPRCRTACIHGTNA